MAYVDLKADDRLIIEALDTIYTVTVDELKDNPNGYIAEDDLLLVYRNDEAYSVSYAVLIDNDSWSFEDSDLFLIARDDINYSVSWGTLRTELGLGDLTAIIETDLPSTGTYSTGVGHDFYFGIVTGGSPDSVTYQWYWEGSPISGATGESFRIDPIYGDDAGRTLSCTCTVTKAGDDNSPIVLDSTMLTISTYKTKDGGSFRTVSKEPPYSDNPNEGDGTWYKENWQGGEVQGTTMGNNQFQFNIPMQDLRRDWCSHRAFCTGNQQSVFTKNDTTRGPCNQDDGNNCWGEDGKGWEAEYWTRWMIYNNNPGEGPSGDNCGQGPCKEAHYCRLEYDKSATHGVTSDATPDTESCNVDLADVPEGSNTDTRYLYRLGQQGKRSEAYVNYKDGPTAYRAWLGCRVRVSSTDQIKFRGWPYQYAYQNRSGNPPGNTGYIAHNALDRWYDPTLSEADNTARAEELNKYSYVITMEDGGLRFNNQYISSLDLKAGHHYTFFFPDAHTQEFTIPAIASIDMVARNGTQMYAFTPRTKHVGQTMLKLRGEHNQDIRLTVS